MKEYSLFELERMLDEGITTSELLVKAYLNEIKKYDGYLKSIGEINPNAIKEAIRLDKERKSKGKRSPLHGIPVVLKDNIGTKKDLHTSAGSMSLESNMVPYDATITKKLIKAGMIILGKANLSEFAYFMSTKAKCGYASKFGQVESPYSKEIDPLGSSTGSGVAVAANLIPVAIGTETNGSIMSPSFANCICGYKPTLGLISRYGIVPISVEQDSAGPMARSVLDLALVANVLQGKDIHDKESLKIKKTYDFVSACNNSLKGKKIGLIDFEDRPYNEEERKYLDELKNIFSPSGTEVVSLKLKERWFDNGTCLRYEYHRDMDEYLKSLGESTSCKTMKDIVEYFHTHPEHAPYGLDILEKSLELPVPFDDNYLKAKEEQTSHASSLLTLIEDNKLDAIAFLNPSTYTAVNGLPSIAVPCKEPHDNEMMAIIFSSKKWNDDVVFSFAHQYEEKTHRRIAPKLEKNII